MEKIKIVPYDNNYFESYENFANKNWGNFCYQGRRDYLQWLYDENPNKNKKATDFLLAVSEGGRVVGCVHKMRISWKVRKRLIDTPSIHDLMVEENYRHGIGLKLIWNALIAEEHAFIPGTKTPMADVMYNKIFKSQNIKIGWYRKILSYIRTVPQVCLNRLFFLKNDNFIINYHKLNKLKNNCSKFNILINPDNSIIDKIILHDDRDNFTTECPNWDRENIKWRFFHPLGPKHILIYYGSDTIDNFIIFSIGPRKGLIIARIIEIKAKNSIILKSMLHFTITIIKKLNGHVLDIISSDNNINQMLKSIGWNIMQSPPKTFLYHKNKEDIFLNPVFHGSAGDCGFEACLTMIQG